jgi:ATP-dependent DNA helicase RecG
MNYSDDELLSLMSGPESDLIERKETFNGSAPDTVRQAVCAFANDLPDHKRCGVIFIGARDDGTSAGLDITDELLRQLADIKTDGNILPPPTLTVERRRLAGADIAVITVKPSEAPPVRYRGRICVRTGSRRGIATAQDERILNEKRRHLDIPFDTHPVRAATLDELNLRLFDEEYLPRAFARDILEANDRTVEQRLAATKMIATADEPTPTVLGLLVLGKRPRDFLAGDYIQFTRFAGDNLADDIIDETVSDGPISEMIRSIEAKLDAHNLIAVDLKTGPTEIRTATYPAIALQQIVRNAVMHRAYDSTNAPIRIYWFADRIEIISPGGPFGTVTQDNFGQPGLTDYRNPNLAEAMRVLGYVQRFGVGIATAKRALEKNGNPPLKFEVSQAAVVCRIERAR